MTDSEPDTGEAGQTDALDRSRAAIDEAKDAVREALDDDVPDLDTPASGEGSDPDDQQVTPRPN